MRKISRLAKFVLKNNKAWWITMLTVMVIIFAATMVATQVVFLRNTISTVMGGERRVLVSGDPSQYTYYKLDGEGFQYYEPKSDFGSKRKTLEEANRLNEVIAEEGFVLLKNENNALPLQGTPKVSVFGKNSANLVYGGSGSGAGNAKKAKTIYDSLSGAGIAYNPTLKKFYENNKASGKGRSGNPAIGITPTGLKTGETPQSSYTDTVKKSYSGYKDAALVVISRIGGEGFDLPRTMKESNGKAVTGANANDHYLQLDNNEKDLLSEVSKEFDKVILIINCATSMELGFLTDDTYNIDAAIWIGSPGGSGINALGRILKGEVNPSGRLIDTFARDFRTDPTWANFSNNLTEDGNVYTLGGSAANAYFVEYEEGIYMGYRYWETRAYMQEDIYGEYDWYDNHVVYPFGYGLSYTNFSWEIIGRSPDANSQLDKDGTINITVRVTNTGLVSGKDIVQLYYTAPYHGDIEKPHVVLGDFAKTQELVPGAHQDLTLSLKVSDMASYDYNDANANGFKGYELDDGSYTISLGKNAHHAWTESAHITYYSIPATRTSQGMFGYTYEKDTHTQTDIQNRFDDVSYHIKKYLSRKDFEGTMPQTPTKEERAVSQEFINSLVYQANDEEMPYYITEMPVTGKTSGNAYKLYDLISYNKETGEVIVDYEDSRWEELLDRLTLAEMSYLIGTGNFNTSHIDSIGKPKTTDPDGPAGFTNFMGDPTVYDTCFYASECVIGATWNKLLAHDMGVMVGIEGLHGNQKGDGRPYSGWYAPAVNIHRSPFSGRNWEYYSEDGFFSGIMGANVVKGAKSKGVYTYVKHFAVNDQETNRDTNGLITWANEQSMREIYLRPFEIIVKDGGATAMMSSFNRIGTVWAGGSYALLTEVLRNEWGFRGMVITDYNLYSHMPADQMIRAGGDINLTQDKRPSTDSATPTQVSLIRAATKNILYTVAGSNAMNGIGEGVVYRYAMPLWIIGLIIANIGLLVIFIVWGVLSTRYKLKKLSQKADNLSAVS